MSYPIGKKYMDVDLFCFCYLFERFFLCRDWMIMRKSIQGDRKEIMGTVRCLKKAIGIPFFFFFFDRKKGPIFREVTITYTCLTTCFMEFVTCLSLIHKQRHVLESYCIQNKNPSLEFYFLHSLPFIINCLDYGGSMAILLSFTEKNRTLQNRTHLDFI